MFRTYRRARVNTAIDVDFCNRIDFLMTKMLKSAMNRKFYIILAMAIVAVSLVLCACVPTGNTVEIKCLTIDQSAFSGLRQGDCIDVGDISVRLTYADGRYKEVSDYCVLEVDGELYEGQVLAAGKHDFVAKYPIADGKYYVAQVTFFVAEAEYPDPTPDPKPDPDPKPHVHNFGTWQAEVAPTCTSLGVIGHKDCLLCDKHFDADGNEIVDITVTVNPTAHDLGVWTDEVEPTIFSDGIVAHKDCNACKKHFDGNDKELSNIILPKIIPTYDVVVRDLSLSTYDTKGYDLADSTRSLVVRVVTDGVFCGNVEVQTQPTSGGSGVYTIVLPRIDFRTNIAVRTTLSTNNAQGVSLFDGGYVAANGVTLTMLSDGTKVVAALSNASGETLQTVELTDGNIICGASGVTLYVQGIRYTSMYLSAMVGMDTSAVEAASQQLQLGQTMAENSATYSVVYDYADEDMQVVATDLANLLGKVKGLSYNVFGTYGGSVVKPNSHYIVLGGNLAEQNGLGFFDLTQTNGYNVKQNYTNLYVYSRTAYGTIKGVYGLLSQLADFEYFTADTYTFDNSSPLTVAKNYAYATNYDFNYSVAGTAEAAYNKLYAYRLGMQSDWLAFSGAGVNVSSNVHNHLDILPYEIYGAAHPQWYEYKSDVGTYVLDFDATDSVMVGAVVNSLKQVLAAKPRQEIFVFGQADTQYGPNVADYLAFVNAVTAEVDVYLQTNEPNRQIIVAMLAYNGTFVPPQNGTAFVGKHAKVAVMFAPVGGRHNTAYDNIDNKQKNTSTGAFDSESIAKRLNEWSELSGMTVLCWLYGTDYFNYMMPFDTLSAMQANVRLAKAAGNELLFYQLQTYGGSTVGSDWQRLKLYVASKLAKNANASVDGLIDDFCNAYFGVAASDMKQLLATERADLYKKRNASGNSDWYGLVNGSALLLNKKCFPLITINGYMKTIDSAKAKVEAAYENGNLTAMELDKLTERIDIESLTFRYILISLHGYTKYDKSVEDFKAYARSLGVVALGETIAN